MSVLNEVDRTGLESQESQERIVEALNHILRSPRFKDSQQLQSLLRYVVDEGLKGDDEALKERMIGVYVFGRRPDYDTTNDPIVRSRMGLLRKRLVQYYEAEAGKGTAVQIVIPNGTYRPTFVVPPSTNKKQIRTAFAELNAPAVPSLGLADLLPAVNSVATLDAAIPPEQTVDSAVVSFWTRRRHWLFIAAITVAAVILIVLGVRSLARRTPQGEIDSLWAPILNSKRPIYVYTGSMPVFEKESPADEATSTEDLYWPVRLPEPPSVDMPQSADHVLSYGEGMLTGSVFADIRVAGFLSKYNRVPVLRSGTNLPFMDLKGSPLILIGSFDNYWTRVLNQDLPFYFDRGFGIRERDGAHRRWHNPLKAEMTPRMMDDYALIFRVMNSKADAPVLAIAGLSTCGTHAAADFVTDPAQMQVLSQIPRKALRNKNLELVLHTSLVNCAPTSVEVIASKVW